MLQFSVFFFERASCTFFSRRVVVWLCFLTSSSTTTTTIHAKELDCFCITVVAVLNYLPCCVCLGSVAEVVSEAARNPRFCAVSCCVLLIYATPKCGVNEVDFCAGLHVEMGVEEFKKCGVWWSKEKHNLQRWRKCRFDLVKLIFSNYLSILKKIY